MKRTLISVALGVLFVLSYMGTVFGTVLIMSDCV